MASIRDNTATLTGSGEPLQLRIGGIRWNFLHLLGVEPQLGRALTADDGLPNAAPVVLLANGLWRERFGADPQVVGSSIVLDGQSTQVVGVLPPSLELLLPREAGLPKRLDAWRPFTFDFHTLPAGQNQLVGNIVVSISLIADPGETELKFVDGIVFPDEDPPERLVPVENLVFMGPAAVRPQLTNGKVVIRKQLSRTAGCSPS